MSSELACIPTSNTRPPPRRRLNPRKLASGMPLAVSCASSTFTRNQSFAKANLGFEVEMDNLNFRAFGSRQLYLRRECDQGGHKWCKRLAA